MTTTTASHIVICACFGWGHLRGLCVLAATIVKLRPITLITFFTSLSMYERVQAEIDQNLDGGDTSLRGNIHVVALPENRDDFPDMTTFDKSFAEQFRKLARSEQFDCAKRGETEAFRAKIAPSLVIVDLFAHSQLAHVRSISPGSKVFCWAPSSVLGVVALLGPFGSDTYGYHRERIQRRMKQTGEPFIDATWNVMAKGHSDDVIECPGLPSLFDYEVVPQKRPVELSNNKFKACGKLYLGASDLLHEADGIISPTVEGFEPPETLAILKQFLAFTSRAFYAVGPLLSPVKVRRDEADTHCACDHTTKEVEALLDSVHHTRGANSLIYMAFGSAFWCAESEKIWAFVETMLNEDIPFIMAHTSVFARVPSNILAQVDNSGIAFLTKWAPQQFVLNHPATGWFVSHCGINSTLESIYAGVPIISWPFGAEQAFNAAHCETTLDIAYELFEVRSSHALRVSRTGETHLGTVAAVQREARAILTKAFGEDGDRKRRNIVKLRDTLVEGRAGESMVEMLLDSI